MKRWRIAVRRKVGGHTVIEKNCVISSYSSSVFEKKMGYHHILTNQTLTAWVRVLVGTKTFMWGGLPADLQYVGVSTYTCEYSDIRTCGVFLYH